MKTVIPHSAFPQRAPGRSGRPSVEQPRASLPVCRKNLAHGEVFTIRFLFFYLLSSDHQESGWRAPIQPGYRGLTRRTRSPAHRHRHSRDLPPSSPSCLCSGTQLGSSGQPTTQSPSGLTVPFLPLLRTDPPSRKPIDRRAGAYVRHAGGVGASAGAWR